MNTFQASSSVGTSWGGNLHLTSCTVLREQLGLNSLQIQQQQEKPTTNKHSSIAQLQLLEMERQSREPRLPSASP